MRRKAKLLKRKLKSASSTWWENILSTRYRQDKPFDNGCNRIIDRQNFFSPGLNNMWRENKRYEMTLTHPLILASASPRREELLRLLGLDFTVIPADVEEENHAGDDPVRHVLFLSGQKARKVAEKHRDFIVLGADTVVVIDRQILGKPQNRMAAVAMLKRLSGREHEVFTGFAVCFARAGFEYSEVVRSLVKFRPLTELEIDWYTGTEEPYDKAGAYAVQGKGAIFIQEIRGSYTNVMGLPVSEVITCLLRENYLTFSKKCR